MQYKLILSKYPNENATHNNDRATHYFKQMPQLTYTFNFFLIFSLRVCFARVSFLSTYYILPVHVCIILHLPDFSLSIIFLIHITIIQTFVISEHCVYNSIKQLIIFDQSKKMFTKSIYVNISCFSFNSLLACDCISFAKSFSPSYTQI